MSTLTFDQRNPANTRLPVSQQRSSGGKALQDNRASTVPTQLQQGHTAQRQEQHTPPNRTGLPDKLKVGIESLSGLSMDSVRVHYNSTQPAQLNALAYAQGNHIHIAPGQERHLPHEAWHVVQQAQGRVRPTMQMKGGVQINDQALLENEADLMGKNAISFGQHVAQTEIGIDKSVNVIRPSFRNNNYQIAQCRFTMNGKEYSFLHAHDINGNPYLASENNSITENWKIDDKQDEIKLTKVEDLYTEINLNDPSEEDSNKVKHNLSMGREQRVKINGQNAILHPFKSYQYSAHKLPDVSVFNVNRDENQMYAVEPGTGKKYKDYYDTFLEGPFKIFLALENEERTESKINDLKNALELIKSRMSPLIFVEDHRTKGALEEFANLWEKEFISKINKDLNLSQSIEIITKITTGLPWALGGGKDNYREKMKNELGIQWVENVRDIGWRDVSPPRSDIGGQFKKIDEENKMGSSQPRKKRRLTPDTTSKNSSKDVDPKLRDSDSRATASWVSAWNDVDPKSRGRGSGRGRGRFQGPRP